jgi:hypothetical protein
MLPHLCKTWDNLFNKTIRMQRFQKNIHFNKDKVLIQDLHRKYRRIMVFNATFKIISVISWQ